MAKLNPVLKPVKARFEAAVAAARVVGFDFTILLQVLPVFVQLIQSCKKQPPPNPNPAPTPAEQKAYEMNWFATSSYVSGKGRYTTTAINQTAREIRRKNKKDGTPITKDESKDLAVAALDEARLNDVATLAAAIEQAGG